ncbi:MAG: hypothetical protein Unbinned1819contig1001_42 [Prokaryotic dsDNA virus sp.]|nr:MAG: hypothetical protein Unbinned1819contig1001_42 [Prokaryotic dsDNA virus sp.]|tara:strand:+ start:823 stop:1026 length:204 start_codon:yes stop_codon:yes gene_type:complete
MNSHFLPEPLDEFFTSQCQRYDCYPLRLTKDEISLLVSLVCDAYDSVDEEKLKTIRSIDNKLTSLLS